MKSPRCDAIAELAQPSRADIVAAAYGVEDLQLRPGYLIPKPFDPRLIVKIAPAVAKAAMDSGVATRPIDGFGGLRPAAACSSSTTPARSMQPMFAGRAKAAPRSASSSPKARTSACCAPCRSSSTKAWPSRSWSAARPSSQQRIERYGLRLRRGVDVRSSTRSTIHATATTGRAITSSRSAAA